MSHTPLNKPLEILPIDGRNDVYLRMVSIDDLDPYYELIDHEREHLKTFQKWAIDTTLENTEEHIKLNLEAMAADKALQYRIIQKEKNKMIGGLGLRERDELKGTCYLGYWIAKDYEGKGVAYAATRQLIEYGFKRWNLKKVILEISPENDRSLRLAKRLGANPTGVFTDGPFPDYPHKNEIWEITDV